MLTRSNWS
jgi:CTP synthase N-terminus